MGGKNEKKEKELYEAQRKAIEAEEAIKFEAQRKAKEERMRGVFKVGEVEFRMIFVEGGTFNMGAAPEIENPRYDEMPVHEVTLDSYYIGETPVTQALW